MNQYVAKSIRIGDRTDIFIKGDLLIDLVTFWNNRWVVHYGNAKHNESVLDIIKYNPYNPQLNPKQQTIYYVPTGK